MKELVETYEDQKELIQIIRHESINNLLRMSDVCGYVVNVDKAHYDIKLKRDGSIVSADDLKHSLDIIKNSKYYTSALYNVLLKN